MQTRLLKRAVGCLVLMSYQLHATIVLRGDSTTPGQTFSFPIATHVYEPSRGFLVVGAQQAPQEASGGYALSVASGVSQTFGPLITGTTAIVNGVQDQPNGLFGAAIADLSLFDYTPQTAYPVAVTQNEPGIVYVLANGLVQASPMNLIKSATLLDANSEPTARIAALTTNFVRPVFDAQRLINGLQNGMAVFAAVSNPRGLFGNPGSGIATSVIMTNTTTKFFDLMPIATTTLDITSPQITIGDPLSQFSDFATFSNFSTLTRQMNIPSSQVFVGLQLVAGAGADDGAIAVLVFSGLLAANAMGFTPPLLQPIVTSSAVTADSIVAAKAPSAAVTIYALGNMKTTTQLRYLIVLGGVAPYGTRRTVFALPLVSETGQLADVTAQPINSFNPYLDRTLPPATAQGQLYTSTSVQAIVGGGVAPGDIDELVVSGDTVFAAISSSTTAQPGIFYSQALFDVSGLVKGWTQWQRAGNSNLATAGLAFDASLGNFFSLLPSQTGIYTVERTVWQAPQQGVQQFIQQQFTGVHGGVQGLFDIPAVTSTLDQTNPIALTIATGNGQVVIAQSAQTENAILTPITTFTNAFTTTNGTLQNFTPGVSSLTFSGGALAQIGAIVAATIITDGTYCWFAVGGAHGLAVLARADGTGWLLSSGLHNGFVGLTADMQWVLCGNYQAVRKLVSNENALYILTQTTLERAAVSPAVFQTAATFHATLLAQGGDLPGGLHYFFSDVIIAKKFALLATSSGLLRVGNGADITTAQISSDVQWTPVELINSVGPVTRLFGISATGLAQDLVTCAPAVSGNIYALNAYVGYDQAQIYRLTLSYTGAITDATLQLIPDTKMTGVNNFFLTFGYYRNYLTTDGAILAVSRSKYLQEPTKLQLLPPSWVTGNSTSIIARAANIIEDEQAHSIGQMIRSSVTGSWLVPGEFGLFVNE